MEAHATETPTKDAVDARLVQALRATGRRVTPQRVILHRALHELGRHATAEDVRRAVGRQLPNLALPTVYDALELFDELGLARRVDAGAGPTLFDPRADHHAHFACRVCGRVVDVEDAPDITAASASARAAGLRVEGAQVLLTGTC